jgi:hypothetical protein
VSDEYVPKYREAGFAPIIRPSGHLKPIPKYWISSKFSVSNPPDFCNFAHFLEKSLAA